MATCAICQQILQDDAAESLGCAHTFHSQCIRQWAKEIDQAVESIACPVCKLTPQQLSAKENMVMGRAPGTPAPGTYCPRTPPRMFLTPMTSSSSGSHELPTAVGNALAVVFPSPGGIDLTGADDTQVWAGGDLDLKFDH